MRPLDSAPSFARNCWSKPSTSIVHHVTPGPGLISVAARNTKITIAVPTSVARASGSSSRTSRHIRNTTMHMEPEKMISWLYGILVSPIVIENAANTRPPPRIHQLTAVSPRSPCTMVWTCSWVSPCALRRRA